MLNFHPVQRVYALQQIPKPSDSKLLICENLWGHPLIAVGAELRQLHSRNLARQRRLVLLSLGRQREKGQRAEENGPYVSQETFLAVSSEIHRNPQANLGA